MRKVYFILGLFFVMSCNFIYSMESNSPFRSAKFSRSSSPYKEVEPLNSGGITPFAQGQKQSMENSSQLDNILSFNRKELASKSPFSVGYGYECVEETKLYDLAQVLVTPIIISAKEGVIIITSNKFMEYVPNLRYLCDALKDIDSNISTNGVENLRNVSQLRFTYGKQLLVVAHGFNDILDEQIYLQREGKSTPLFIKFIPYKYYRQYYMALLKCIEQK